MDRYDGDLWRALATPTIELRADGPDDGRLATLDIDFARFGVWNEIDSYFEGRFLERLDRGAFAKTMSERRNAIKVLFNHGHDARTGDHVLGQILDLGERDSGPFGEVALFDDDLVREKLPGLRAGVYGASYRFRVVREEWNDEPERSDHNPEGIPERTIKEVRLFEFGPVTFPADEGTAVGVRSLTDRYLRTPDGRAAPTRGTRPDGAANTTDEPPAGHSEAPPTVDPAAYRRRVLQLQGVL